MASELMWGLKNAPAHYALLNACRALVFLLQERLVGKTAAGRWAIDRGIEPKNSIARALDTQTGTAPGGSLTAVEAEFITRTVTALSAAAEAEQFERARRQ